MKKIFSLFCTVMMTVLVFGQSYGILVNGHTYFAGESAGENEGFTQYLSHVQLQSGDYCQLYDAENKAAWAVTLNSYSVEGFALNNDRYEVTVDGCYDFYIKLKYGQDELYIGNGSNCGEGEEIAGEGDGSVEIKFSEVVSNDDLAEDATFSVAGSTFAAQVTDPDNKMQIDANTCRFGTADAYVSYSHRLKTGGKSSATKNFITLTIPEDGTLNIAVRTGSNSATDRSLVVKQGETELFNQVILESSAIKVMEGETEVSVYPYITVPVKAGSVLLNYPVSGINFYAFAFKAGETPEPVTPVDSMTVYFVNDAAWENVDAFVWPAEGDAYKNWPGEAMNKEAEQINGFDVYSYTFPASYVNIIFNNGGEGNQTADLVWDATKPYFFDGEWYASVEEVAPHCAQVTEGIWTVTETTPLDANSIYVHNNLMKMKPAYAAAWDGFNNPQQFGEYSFTYAMLIRSDAWPTEQIPAGAEYVGGSKNTTSLIVEAKEDIDITIFYRRQTGNQSENDSKDLKIFDHSAITTAIQGVFQIVEIDGDYFSATKKLSLVKGHRYTITAKGTTPKIFAIAYGQHAEPEPAKFYITGNDALVGEELAWQANAIMVTEDSYTFENLAAGDYKLKVTVNGTWEEGMVKGFSDLTTVADGLTADADGNICFTLAEAGNVSVHYDGEYFFLNGNFYVVPVVSADYYMKNGWDGGEWTWKAMTLDEGTYFLANVVVSGDGVNLNNAATDEGASWIEWAEIETYDYWSYEEATISALDTVVFMFDPEAVNQYTGANGLSAVILGKYVAPVDPQGLYLIGNAPEMASWAIENALPMDGDSIVLNLAEGGYAFKIVPTKAWDQPGQLDCNAIAEGQDKLSCDGSYNICFTMPSAAEVIIKVIEDQVYVLGIPDGEYIIPTTHYLIGNVEQMGEWNIENAVFMDGDSLQLTLAEGTIMFKIVTTKAWDQPGQLDCSNLAEGQANVGCEGNYIDQKNVKFILNEEATITIKVIEDEIYVLGIPEGPQPEPAKFYITGDAALLGEELAWNPAAIKVTEDSYTFENLAAGDYKLKVTVDGTWETVKGFSDLTTVADGLTADVDGNICFTLTEAGNVSVHYDGEYFFLNGNFYVVPVVSADYYMKNGWDGGEWTWKAMTLDEGTYFLANVVVSGDGVNLNNAATDEGASWIEWAEIETYDMSYEAATISALDTVVFMFDPEAVNQYTGANGLSAVILGKYVAPVDPQQYEYGLLVDGTFVPATKNTEYVGEGEEWVVTTNLVAGNKFQNYENTTSAGWLVPFDPNEGNYTNFDIEDNFYVVKESGNYTFYIKLIFENDNMWVVKNEATAISNTAADAEAVKVLHNGMLLIRKGNRTYTIMGQAVK